MWRNRCVVISDISRSIRSASRAVTTVLVMKSETGSFKTLGPDWPIARMRSRSDTMSATLPLSPSMTMQPMPCCSSSFAISSNDLSLVVVTTPYLQLQNCRDVHLVSSSLSNFRPRSPATYDSSPIDNVTAYRFEAEFVSAGLARVINPLWVSAAKAMLENCSSAE